MENHAARSRLVGGFRQSALDLWSLVILFQCAGTRLRDIRSGGIGPCAVSCKIYSHDQSYVARLVEKNIDENIHLEKQKQPRSSSQKRKSKSSTNNSKAELRFLPLDWELDEVTPSLTGNDKAKSFDAIIACDCIYNDTLIKPLVQTCADACKLRSADESICDRPTICLVAQQLRDPEIFEGWIKEFSKHFRVWRLPDNASNEELRLNPGFVVHLGILQDVANRS